MRALLYRPSWQALRVSFLAENRSDGGWTTPEGTGHNLGRVMLYVSLNDASYGNFEAEADAMGYKVQHEIAARLYRAINCLNAVRMGNSGQGTKGSEQDKLVLAVRDQLQGRQAVSYHQLLTYAAVRWDWRVVKKELEALYGEHPRSFIQVERNLKTRQERSLSTGTRRELVTFVELMKEVRIGD